MSNIKDILHQHRRQSKQDQIYEALAEKRANDFKREYYKKIQDGVDATPVEVKRKFIALMKEGKTLGEARKEAGIEDLSVAAKIFEQSIGRYEFLKNPEDIT
jgi:hypothetical protein